MHQRGPNGAGRRVDVAARQSSASAAAAAATLAATSSSDDSAVSSPACEASMGLTSRRASKVVPCATGITRPVASSTDSSFSAMPSASMLLSSAGVTRTIPTREFLRPLSISRSICLPRATSFSLNQTVAPLDFRRSYNSEALPSLSSQAWQRKRSRRSGCSRACSTALRARGSMERHSEAVYDTDPPALARRALPPPDDPPRVDPPPPNDDPLRYEGTGGEYE